MKVLKIEKNYVWFPINLNKPKKLVNIVKENQKIGELLINIDVKNPSYYLPYNLAKYQGENIDFLVDKTSQVVLFQTNSLNEGINRDLKNRPSLHFMPKFGWMNDPNGLIYRDGYYHLFFQHNPVGLDWGNMHWGHARSENLIEWEELREAITPDEFGEAFSGSAILPPKDSKEYNFFDKKILLFYTAAGGDSHWSKGKKHTQRIALFDDKNQEVTKTNFVLGNIKASNRDPKVFYHYGSDAYVMLLYLDGNEFILLRSSDLIEWKEYQRFELDFAWECPELFLLEVQESNEKKWIFMVADGFYYTCEFDGYKISNFSQMKRAYQNALPYAAQTYANVDYRTIKHVWLRTPNKGLLSTGLMSIPTELSLIKINEEYYLQQKPIRELEKYWKQYFSSNDCFCEHHTPLNSPFKIELAGVFSENSQCYLKIGINKIFIEFEEKILFINDMKIDISNFIYHEHWDLCLIVDEQIIELYMCQYTFYYPIEIEELKSEYELEISYENFLKCQSDLYW